MFRKIIKFLSRVIGMNRVTYEDLRMAAEKEEWDFVDANIPKVVARKDAIDWALHEAIKSANVNVRDLGASMIGKAKISSNVFAKMRPSLFGLLERDADNYAGFRAACALAEHGPDKYLSDVRKTLQRFSKDKDVGGIAREYLQKIS